MLNSIYQSLNPIAFTIGPLTVRWYGIAYVLGFILAAVIIWRVGKRWRVRINEDALLTIMLCAVLGIIIGARLGYCLFYGSGYYLQNPGEILAFSNGGMSFHGGLIGGLLSGIVAAKLTGIPYLTLADIGVIGAPLGLFFGRCANFINGELWGAPTDAPWGVVFANAGGVARHPSQLYEAVLEGLVIFIVLFALSRKQPPRPRGTFLGVFLTMYGVFRFSVEFVRQPDAQLGYLFGTDWITMGQVLSVPLVVIGVCLLVYAGRAKLPQVGMSEDEGGADKDMNGDNVDASADSNDVVSDNVSNTCAGAGVAGVVDIDADATKNSHANELMDIYDENQKLLGYTKARRDMFLKKGEYVLYVLAIIQDASGKFLITQRATTKKWAPGAWEVQGGGVSAGETCEQAIVREVREEVGLDVVTLRTAGDCKEKRGSNKQNKRSLNSDTSNHAPLPAPIYTYTNTDIKRGDNYIVNMYHFCLNFCESDVKIAKREATNFKLVEWSEIEQLNEQGKFLHFKRVCEALRAQGCMSDGGVIINSESCTGKHGEMSKAAKMQTKTPNKNTSKNK